MTLFIPDDPRKWWRLITHFDLGKALTEIEAMSLGNTVAKDPLEDAFALFRDGQVEAAIAAYRDLLTTDPANAEANHMIGVIAFQQGKNDIAREFVQRATEAPSGVTPEMYN